MSVYAKHQFGNYQMIRLLFIMSLVGLIVAGSGITWLVTGYIQLAQRAALYNGSWINQQKPGRLVTQLKINNNGVILAVHAFGDLAGQIPNCPKCDLGTNSGSFTGEPFTITVESIFNNQILDLIITMNLNNTDSTQLKVVVNPISIQLDGVAYTPASVFVKDRP